jgi:sensor histidine kinase YesM
MTITSGNHNEYQQSRPEVTLAGIGIAVLFGFIYTLLNTVIIASSNEAPFSGIFISELVSALILMAYMVPAWFLMVRKFYDMKALYLFLLHIGLGALVSYAWYYSFVWAFGLLFNIEQLGEAFFENKDWILLSTFLIYAVAFSVIHIMYAMRRKRQDERRITRWKEHSRQLELANLKAQLNPHFLFNTLNSINAYVTKDPNETRRMIAQLADMLRYSLDSFEKDTVHLNEELDFTENYLSLEKKRLGDRLTFNIHKEPSLDDIPVPPMIIQPLVENAIKHGINPTNKAGMVEVTIEQDNGRAMISISDTGRGVDPENALSSDGIGLRNTNEVLTNKYGPESQLQFGKNSEGGALIYFYIPITDL